MEQPNITITVSFEEQSKSVTAKTKIEINTPLTTESIETLAEDIRKKAQTLFDEAFKYSQQKTIEKTR